MKKQNINIDNYEIFFMDYLANQLDEKLVDELFLFLENNPSIAEDIQNLNDFSLKAKPIVFDKSALFVSEHLTPENPIDNENYEEFLIRKIENELDSEEQEALRVFLLSNNEYVHDDKMFQLTKLHASNNIKFEPKQSLYKLAIDQNEPISPENIEEYIIAFYERILSKNQKNDLLIWISKNEKYQKLFDDYSNLRLDADESIVFAHKESLKQKAPIFYLNEVYFKYITSIAAVLVVFLMFPSLLNNGFNVDNSTTKGNEKHQIISQPTNNISVLATVEPAIEKRIKLAEKSTNRASANVDSEISKAKRKSIQLEINPMVEMKAYKSEYYYANQKNISGYYEVTAVESNFISENPELVKRVVKGVRNALKINTEQTKLPEDKFTFWDIAEVGINSFNALTENEIILTHQ
jgi:hypothetical protein